MDNNDLLKNKFQKLHAELVGQNLSAVVDRLFAAAIISAENMENLHSWSGSAGWSSAKSRLLMTLLHRSSHPRAFTELRQALYEDDCMKWIVDKLDKMEVQKEHAYSEGQCPYCKPAHYTASPAEGQ